MLFYCSRNPAASPPEVLWLKGDVSQWNLVLMLLVSESCRFLSPVLRSFFFSHFNGAQL